jgi:hypothetical protein
MSPRAAVIATIACLASVALAGCAQPPSARTVANPIPAPTALQLSSVELNVALLPVSDFPAGYAAGTQGSPNSASLLLSGTPSPAPGKSRGCQQSITDAITSPSGLTAVASEALYSTAGHPSKHRQVLLSQGVFQFGSPSLAAAYIESLRAVFTRCPTSTTAGGAEYKNTALPAPTVAGQQALLLRQVSTPNSVPAVTEVALCTLDGADVYLVSVDSVGVPVPAQVSLPDLTAKLITRVKGTV